MFKNYFFALFLFTVLAACGGGSSTISNNPNSQTMPSPASLVSRDGQQQQLVGDTSNNGYGVAVENFTVVDQINGYEILKSSESQNHYIRKINGQEILLGFDPIHVDISYTGLPNRFDSISQASGIYEMLGTGMIADNERGVTEYGSLEFNIDLTPGNLTTYSQQVLTDRYVAGSLGRVDSNGNLIGQGDVGENIGTPDLPILVVSTSGEFSGKLSGSSLEDATLIGSGEAGSGRFVVTYAGDGLQPYSEYE